MQRTSAENHERSQPGVQGRERWTFDGPPSRRQARWKAGLGVYGAEAEAWAKPPFVNTTSRCRRSRGGAAEHAGTSCRSSSAPTSGAPTQLSTWSAGRGATINVAPLVAKPCLLWPGSSPGENPVGKILATADADIPCEIRQPFSEQKREYRHDADFTSLRSCRSNVKTCSGRRAQIL